MKKPLMTVPEVAAALHVSACTVYRLKDKSGGLRACRVGRCLRFKPEDVEAYLTAHVVEPVERPAGRPGRIRFQYVPGMKVV